MRIPYRFDAMHLTCDRAEVTIEPIAQDRFWARAALYRSYTTRILTSARAVRYARIGFAACLLLPVLISGESALKRTVYHWVGQAFEARFQRPVLRADEDIAGVVSLGGGMDRVREAMTLARRFPNAMLIVTGPSDEERDLALSDPALAGRVIVDPLARNTFENAVYAKNLARADRNQTWLMVTSAVHMPRAMGAFQGAGFAVKAWPVQDTPADEPEAHRRLTHEILGLVAYRFMGRIRAFFPGPA